MLLQAAIATIAVVVGMTLHAVSHWAGWVAAAVVLLSVFGLSALAERVLATRLGALRVVISGMRLSGDLTARAPVEGDDEVAAAAREFNALIESFQTIIGKVFFNSIEFARTAHQ
ncbi:MAG: HAMP domain-containing protein, partial [Rhodocyclaceae bacterium]